MTTTSAETIETPSGEITLSPDIIRSYLVNGDGAVTDQEIAFFIQMCRANRLNPFNKDAYLIKYPGNQPATTVVSKTVFERIAEAHPQFDGIETGVIVAHQDGTTERKPDGFYLPGKEKLVGAWAEVYRKDRSRPFKTSVVLDECIGRKKDGTPNRMWTSSPAMMVCKVAAARALRGAFPNDLQGMYDSSEVQPPQLETRERKGGLRAVLGTQPEPEVADVVTGEVVEAEPDDQDEPDHTPDDGPLTHSQSNTLHGLLRQQFPALKGDELRAKSLAYCAHTIGRPVDSTTSLTKTEATQIIDQLQNEVTDNA